MSGVEARVTPGPGTGGARSPTLLDAGEVTSDRRLAGVRGPPDIPTACTRRLDPTSTPSGRPAAVRRFPRTFARRRRSRDPGSDAVRRGAVALRGDVLRSSRELEEATVVSLHPWTRMGRCCCRPRRRRRFAFFPNRIPRSTAEWSSTRSKGGLPHRPGAMECPEARTGSIGGLLAVLWRRVGTVGRIT